MDQANDPAITLWFSPSLQRDPGSCTIQTAEGKLPEAQALQHPAIVKQKVQKTNIIATQKTGCTDVIMPTKWLLSDESLAPVRDNEMRCITDQDIIIAVLGPTGVGKSSFVNIATSQHVANVGDDLASCTQAVSAFSCRHPDSGRNVVFVDTPGFDDSERTDYEILKAIADWLERTYKQRILLTGILLLHRISESRMRGAPLRNLAMFEELCGVDALQNVILTTTMWDEVVGDVGLRRERQLQTDFWQPMMSRGCRMARFSSSPESAWEIVNMFDIVTRRPLEVQTQLVDQGKKLAETSAFSALLRWWDQLIAMLWSPKANHADRGRQLDWALNQKRNLTMYQHLELPSVRSLPETCDIGPPNKTSNRGRKHRVKFGSFRRVLSP